MKLFLPDYVKYALNTLKNAGFDVWIVGGSVRDSIMGKLPQDYDIATSALPEQVIKLFEKTIPTGIKHGTVTVVLEKNNIEITTFRTEKGYDDSRHPNEVSFVSDIKEDLSRRDFTVNAIAYNESGIYDPFSGTQDIKNKVLKTVGKAHERFREDALRIMRLFRFACVLDFKIEKDALQGAIDCSDLLKKVSVERIREELLKMLCGASPCVFNELLKTGSLSFIGLTEKMQVPKELNILPALPAQRLSYFCYKNKLNVLNICTALKTSNEFSKECQCIYSLLDFKNINSKLEIKKQMFKYGADYVRSYISVVDALNDANLSAMYEEIINNNEPYKIDMLKLNGDDIKELGYSGKDVGKALEFLTNRVIENPEDNTGEKLKSLL